MLQAEKGAKRAEVVLEKADVKEEAAFKVLLRMQARMDGLDTGTSAKMTRHWFKLWEAAEERWRDAASTSKDVEIEKLEAQLNHRDAENEMLHFLLNAAFAREDACA